MGVAVYPVALDADALEFLVRTHWLSEEDAGDRQAVAAAIGALLDDAARR